MPHKSPRKRLTLLLVNCLTASSYLIAPPACCAYEFAPPPDSDYSKIDEIEQRGDKEAKDGKLDEAVEIRKNAINLLLKAPPKIQTAYKCQQLAVELGSGRTVENSELIALNKYALEIYDQILEPNSPQSILVLVRLAELHYRKDTLKETETYWIRALKATENAYGEDDSRVAKICDQLGKFYRGEKNWTEMEKMLKRSSQIYDLSLEANTLHGATARDELAEAYYEQGKLAEAEDLYNTAIVSYSKSFGPNSILVASLMDQLSDVYTKAGKLESAEKTLKQSIEIKKKSSGPGCEFLLTTLDRYAHLMDVKNDSARASQLRKEAQAIRDKYSESERTPI